MLLSGRIRLNIPMAREGTRVEFLCRLQREAEPRARARGHYELFSQSSPDAGCWSRECFASSHRAFLKRKHIKPVVTAYRSSRELGSLIFLPWLCDIRTTAIQSRNYDSAVIDALSLVNQHALPGDLYWDTAWSVIPPFRPRPRGTYSIFFPY